MREILFKAKAINRDKGYHRTNYKNGDWVCGLITRLYDERFENLPAEMTDENGVSRIEIDHNTICQYTGLTDYDGNKIWENDIIRLHDFTSEDYIVVWNKDMGAYVICTAITKLESIDLVGDCVQEIQYVEVIGNIFDNPELMNTTETIGHTDNGGLMSAT